MLMLITYDLNKMWTEVKRAAIAAGFRDFAITNDSRSFDLPNTTLLVEASSPDEAMKKFINVARSVSPTIVIERAAAFDWSTGTTHADPQGLGFLGEMFRSQGPR